MNNIEKDLDKKEEFNKLNKYLLEQEILLEHDKEKQNKELCKKILENYDAICTNIKYEKE